jgi:hypothetical protein
MTVNFAAPRTASLFGWRRDEDCNAWAIDIHVTLRPAGHLAPGRGIALVVPGGDKGDIDNWALATRFYVLRR